MIRLLGIILIAALALAVLKVAIVALLLAFALVLLWGFLARPAETFGLLLFGAWLTLMQNHAALGLTILAFAAYLALKTKHSPDNPGFVVEAKEEPVPPESHGPKN